MIGRELERRGLIYVLVIYGLAPWVVEKLT